MKFFVVIAIVSLYWRAVACKNESASLPLSNDTLAETGNSLSCIEMQECIKTCLSNTKMMFKKKLFQLMT